MKVRNIRKQLAIFCLFLNLSCLFCVAFQTSQITESANHDTLVSTNNSNVDSIGISQLSDPHLTISDTIESKEGKISSNITEIIEGCLVSREESAAEDQPAIYIPNWNLTFARLNFENITALNYTKSIENFPTKVIGSTNESETIVFQKFSVEIDQYINNVSLFLQDIPQGYPDNPVYTYENQWEVAIVNCSDDSDLTPDKDGIMGVLRKNHPDDIPAHWETFDFENDGDGPVFLNTSNTASTVEGGTTKYWFALKITMPRDDSKVGGGPKFLYFNPDSQGAGDDEGDIFKYGEFLGANYTRNNVIFNATYDGILIDGGLSSFTEIDDNKYIVNSEGGENNVSIITNFGLNNLSINYELIRDIKYYPQRIKDLTKIYSPYAVLLALIHQDLFFPFVWYAAHYLFLYNVNISLVANVSDIENIDQATTWVYSATEKGWKNISQMIDFELKTEDELVQSMELKDPTEKIEFLKFLNDANYDDGIPFNSIDVDPNNSNNTLQFAFTYNGTSPYNISINKFTIDIGELRYVNKTIKEDPIVVDKYFAEYIELSNGTFVTSEEDRFDTLEFNDGMRFLAQAGTNNLTIELGSYVLNDIDNSNWEGIDVYDWLFLAPNPLIPEMQIIITSNTSINHPYNITLGKLEFYKGNETSDLLTEAQNKAEWIRLGDSDRIFADVEEDRHVFTIDSYYTYILLNFLNQSENNKFRLRLRFKTNDTETGLGFFVSINEFSISFDLKKPSDIASTIAFGLNSAKLNPEQIEMETFGNKISFDGYQKGVWESVIVDGEPTQGSFTFNISSIWPTIKFDVNATYTIEKFHSFDWHYALDTSDTNVFWNVSSDITYYLPPDAFYIDGSKTLQINVPSDWFYMTSYNATDPDSVKNVGGWFWENQTVGFKKYITLCNISEGFWKIELNSSIAEMEVSYSSTLTPKIDEKISITPTIRDVFGGNLYFEVYDNSLDLLYSDNILLNESAQENSTTFLFDIFSYTKDPGTFYLKTFWTKSNASTVLVSLDTRTLQVSKYNVDLEILDIEEFENEYIHGSEIVIRGELKNDDNDAEIEGETVKIIIEDENGKEIDELTDITNEDGIVEVKYELPSDTSSIKISLEYDSEGTYYSAGETDNDLEISLISQGQYYLNIFLGILPYILAVVAGIVIFVALRHRRLQKLREVWAEDALILEDLLKISYIMIIHKEAGVTIFSKQISMDLDSDLIGGFLTAISEFRTELKKDTVKEIKGQGFEMDYYDSKIVITDGVYARVALILDGEPSENLKLHQRAFTDEFESKYGNLLRNFDGGIKAFKTANSLIEKYFDISLMYPLQLSKHWEFTEINKLERALVEVAQQMQKEKQFFFVSSLLNYGLAGRKESKNQIISAIINLKRRGIIVPVEIE
ncbi:MAG: hypothetical protein GF383_03230 [Candidatus Lokiarchaeota archaeon]|nr:hypothetical protein [Candidatus Lokiarchaeota archaeon]MBD3338627.1 hypothetical protein [Candidatus Lokiarchaeota archaeon]